MSAVLRPNWLHCILCIIIFYLTVLNLILNQFLYHFKTVLLFLTSCFYCCEWLFHFLLCKALWITNVYEMCYTNKLALPIWCMMSRCDSVLQYKPVTDMTCCALMKNWMKSWLTRDCAFYNVFTKKLNIYIQQGCIKLIWSACDDISNVTKFLFRIPFAISTEK